VSFWGLALFICFALQDGWADYYIPEYINFELAAKYRRYFSRKRQYISSIVLAAVNGIEMF
jgi:hypothetical protein